MQGGGAWDGDRAPCPWRGGGWWTVLGREREREEGGGGFWFWGRDEAGEYLKVKLAIIWILNFDIR